jgi:hypothetical protein
MNNEHVTLSNKGGNTKQISAMEHNVIVMSESGKPIFSRFGDQGKIARICGLVQAVRTAIHGSKSTLGLGEIQSIRSSRLCIVFMTVESITLVSISERTKSNVGNENENGNIDVMETEAYGRLQLEYVYAHIILMLTNNVQKIYENNPAFDLRSMMNSSDNLLRGILDESGPEGNAGPFLVSGVQSCFPLSYKVRHKCSKVLQSIAGRMENNTAFALLIVGDRLLAVVQPSFRPHQLRVSDLHLILNFINLQPGLISSELWIPMCLPRFNSSGFLYAYTSCLDIPSKLTLILLSSHNTTEQFQLLRAASKNIRESLGLPSVSDSVLTIVEDEPKSISSSTDVAWKRTSESFDNSTTDEGYVNISTDMIGNYTSTTSIMEEGELLRQVRQSLQLSSLDRICDQYLDDQHAPSLLHFLFRLDVPVENSSTSNRNKHHQQKPGYLPQCISPAVTAPFESTASRRRLWSNYQKLSLRLRLGSATVESSMDAFDMIQNDSCSDEIDTNGPAAFSGIGSQCPAIGLHESPPYNKDGLSYIVEGEEIYLAMNGKHFELYMVTPSNIPVKRAATIGTKLVREIIRDERILFLSKPLTWRV